MEAAEPWVEESFALNDTELKYGHKDIMIR